MPLSGIDVGKNIAKVLRAGRSGVARDLQRAESLIVNDLRLDLSRPGRGRTYSTYFFTGHDGRVHPIGNRVPHVASAPGDPPAVDTGALRASYGSDSHLTPNGAEGRVGTGEQKAVYWEFGTSKMLPRPHLRPAMTRHRATIRREVKNGIVGRERTMARRLGGRG